MAVLLHNGHYGYAIEHEALDGNCNPSNNVKKKLSSYTFNAKPSRMILHPHDEPRSMQYRVSTARKLEAP